MINIGLGVLLLIGGGPLIAMAEATAEPPARTVGAAERLPQPQPHHGLAALAARTGWRPLERFRDGAAYLSERVIYTDTVTGSEVWQMTVDPGIDQVAYYDLPEWNADGSLLRFNSARSTQPMWIMNADGTGLHPLPLKSSEGGYWSMLDPQVWWLEQRDEAGSRVVALNIQTREKTVIARTKRPNLRLLPPHPREQFFLMARSNASGAECEVVMLGKDGSERVVPIGGKFHRLRFTKADNLQIFFNRDDPRTQWVIMPDGSGRRQLPDAGVHPDWTADGSELTYFTPQGVMALKPGSEPRVMIRAGGGHGGPTLDGRFFIADQGPGGRFPDCIIYAPTDGRGDAQTVAYHGSAMWLHNAASRCHPDHHSSHPHPSFSPDGTKAVFSSYFGRAFTDVHVVICRYPDPPRHLALRREDGRVILRWDPPQEHRELRGYAVLRRTGNGGGCEQINRTLSKECSYLDPSPPDAAADYVVMAVEHSGLTSDPAILGGTDASQASRRPEARLDRKPRLVKSPPLPPSHLTAKAIDAFHVELTWTASTDLSTQYYHVYNVPTPQTNGSQATRIASPAATQTQMVDWARTPGTTQHYRVTAVDNSGHESKPSTAATVALPDLRIVDIERRAADSELGSGVELIDTSDGQRAAALKPAASEGDATLTWKLDVPQSGEYAVWIEQSAPASTPVRKASIQWGEGEPVESDLFGSFGKFTWWPISSSPSATPLRFHLETGATTLRLRLHGEGIQIRRILVTNDATRMPEEFAAPPVSHLQPKEPAIR